VSRGRYEREDQKKDKQRESEKGKWKENKKANKHVSYLSFFPPFKPINGTFTLVGMIPRANRKALSQMDGWNHHARDKGMLAQSQSSIFLLLSCSRELGRIDR
jgi:hypothetical protein